MLHEQVVVNVAIDNVIKITCLEISNILLNILFLMCHIYAWKHFMHNTSCT